MCDPRRALVERRDQKGARCGRVAGRQAVLVNEDKNLAAILAHFLLELLRRQTLADVLRDEGFDVVAVDSGGAALDELRSSSPPRLIVLDLMMPGMDGWDLRHEQMRDPKLAKIPVIAVSAAGKLPDADLQFRKPLDLDRFLTAVKQYIQPANVGGDCQREDPFCHGRRTKRWPVPSGRPSERHGLEKRR
jgi:two-component system chemotaxis response regulator CheY